MSPTPSQVAFSLSAPLMQVVRSTRRHPVSTLAPAALMLLPLIPLVLGVEVVLRGGGSSALQGLIAGAPVGRPGALILRPDTGGWVLLGALAALLATMLAVVVAAGLVTGAAGASPTPIRGRRGPSVADTIKNAFAVWPAMLAVLVIQFVAVAVAAACIGVVAVYAGKVQFQLPTVILTLGLGWILILLVRASLWPAIALAENRPAFSSLVRSFRLSHGHVARILGAALAAFLLVFVPVALLQVLIKALLTMLAGQELIDLSPLAIDLWALVPVPVGVLLLSTLWGRETPVLYAAIRDFPGDDELA
ncbi:MAG: hypothetical protein Q7T55_20370 [Solirubrobacteraceae bacterium]|nr:hypothetical protein [Solirubrobacteraceae bacterium]